MRSRKGFVKKIILGTWCLGITFSNMPMQQIIHAEGNVFFHADPEEKIIEEKLTNERLNCLLVEAVKSNNIKKVKRLLHCKLEVPNIDAIQKFSYHYTLRNTRLHRYYNETVLIHAVRFGYKAIVKELIKAGAELDILCAGEYHFYEHPCTALQLALLKQHNDLAKILIYAGADAPLSIQELSFREGTKELKTLERSYEVYRNEIRNHIEKYIIPDIADIVLAYIFKGLIINVHTEQSCCAIQ